MFKHEVVKNFIAQINTMGNNRLQHRDGAAYASVPRTKHETPTGCLRFQEASCQIQLMKLAVLVC